MRLDLPSNAGFVKNVAALEGRPRSSKDQTVETASGGERERDMSVAMSSET